MKIDYKNAVRRTDCVRGICCVFFSLLKNFPSAACRYVHALSRHVNLPLKISVLVIKPSQ